MNQTPADRLAFVSQALATMGASPEWDACIAEYLRCEALQFADVEFGDYAAANERYAFGQRAIGADDTASERAKKLAHNSRLSAEEDAARQTWEREYLAPFDAAARALVVAPAPSLAAALWKVNLIHLEDLHMDTAIGTKAMEAVRRDMAAHSGMQGARQREEA